MKILGTLTLSKVSAMTIGKNIYIFVKEIDEGLIFHEKWHTLQYIQEGVFKFLFKYYRSFLKNFAKYKNVRTAYFYTTFEREAYEAESLFLGTKVLVDGWLTIGDDIIAVPERLPIRKKSCEVLEVIKAKHKFLIIRECLEKLKDDGILRFIDQ